MLSLSAVNVSRRRRRVLSNVSFDLSPGATALVGPNGAGKTTLMRALIGLHREITGQVLFENQSIFTPDGRRELRRHVGFQAQLTDGKTHLTVRESVEYAAWLKAVEKAQRRGAVDRALERAGVEHLSRRNSSQLSGGEAKRLLIAQAIVHEPRLLMLDEPTAALDPRERNTLLRLLQTLKRDTTILVSTHNTSDVATVCDSVLLVGNEHLLFSGGIDSFAAGGESGHGLAHALDTAYSSILGVNK